MWIVARCAELAAALTFSLLLLACSSPQTSYSEHVQRGQSYLAQGNLQKAQVEFRNAMQVLPGRPDASVLAGQVAEELGDLRAAAALYQSAIDIDPHNVDAQARLGRLYVLTGDPKHGLDVIETSLQQHPDDPALLTVRGAARAALKDMPAALADAERAIRMAPNDENAVALLAALYQRSANTQRAVDLLLAALRVRPDSVDLRRILADLYEKQGQAGPAERQLLQIATFRSQDFAPRAALVDFYIRASRLDDAQRTLKAGMVALPNQDGPRLAYIEFLSKWRPRQEREQALTELLAHYPDDYELQLAHGALLLQEDKPDAAAEAYRVILRQAGAKTEGLLARNRLAAILITQRHFEDASALLQQVLAENGRDADALAMRANIALERGETAAAVADLRTVLRDQPGSVLILRSLARAYLADDQPSLAEESLRNALDAAPDDLATRMELAQLLASAQRLDAAISLLTETAQRLPKELSPREALVHAYLAKPDLEAAQNAAVNVTVAFAGDWRGPYLEALVAESQGRPKQAVAALERALVVQPDALAALQEISRLETRGSQADRAVTRLRSVIANRPDDAGVHDLLGEVLADRDAAAAIAELRRAVDLRPTWWVPYHHLGTVQVATGDSAGAIKTLQQGVDSTRLEAPLVGDLASLYQRQSQPQAAISLYDRFCKDFPGSTFGANNLAMLLVTFGQDHASLERARDLTARFMNATNPDLLDTAGWVRLKLGEVTVALPVLEDAAHRAPQSAIVRYHLGMAQLQAGQWAAARASLESAVAARIHFDGWDIARETLARLGG
jgi:tetratricopeptide (TPR) repeat protein